MTADDTALEAHVQRIRAMVELRHADTLAESVPAEPPIDELARLAVVNAHWGIGSDIPVVGRVVVLFRRLLRFVLRWYVNPIVEQQNAFNEAAVSAIYQLSLEQERLRAETRSASMANPER